MAAYYTPAPKPRSVPCTAKGPLMVVTPNSVGVGSLKMTGSSNHTHTNTERTTANLHPWPSLRRCGSRRRHMVLRRYLETRSHHACQRGVATIHGILRGFHQDYSHYCQCWHLYIHQQLWRQLDKSS